MCLSPNTLNDGTVVPCRLCWQCRLTYINDWSGRCIAESKAAVASHAVTLTYGRDLSVDSLTYGEPDHERAAYLTYSDVQKYFKLLRRHGFPLRYFVTGEYGSEKGRAHWHIIIFWQERVPPGIELDKRFIHYRYDESGEIAALEDGSPAMFWPHGTSFFTEATYEGVRYNCKYIQKDIGEAERQGHLAMSKKPPLGAYYFAQLAEKYVAQGLVPLGTGEEMAPEGTDPEAWKGPGAFVYTFPEALKKSGKRVQFQLRETSLALFLDRFIGYWLETYGKPSWPASRLVDEHYKKPVSRDEREREGKFNLKMAELEEASFENLMYDKLRARLKKEQQVLLLSRLKYDGDLECYTYRTSSNKHVFGRMLYYREGKWTGGKA